MIKIKKSRVNCSHFVVRWNSNIIIFRSLNSGKGLDFTPLPDPVQEQVNEAIGHGFDGMIVYVDQAGRPPEHYTGGWKDRKNKIPADSKSLFNIASHTPRQLSNQGYDI